MRIIVAGPAWPYRGGIAEFSNRLTKQFLDEGHNAEIVTFTLQYPGFLFPGRTQYTDSPAPERLKIRRMINSVNPLNWIKTGFRLKREKPDILLLRFWLPFMGPALGTIARIVRSNQHTKVLCIFDNVIPHEKRPGDRILTNYLVSGIDGAVVMASSVGDDLKEFSRNLQVKYNPHPIYDNYGTSVDRRVALKYLDLDPDYRYILFFGFIRAYKGLDLLLQAISEEPLKKKMIRLVIAGEFYEDDAPYLQLIEKNGLEKNVVLMNRFIRNEEVTYFFSLADIVVQPYKSATQSGVTQIAYHFEKPMLVTDVGGLKEIVPDRKCGYVVSPDPNAIADALADFFENDRQKTFAAAVAEEKKKFSWDKMTGTILDFLPGKP